METTDEELVERARMGDNGAFDQLLSRHRSRAFSWAKHIVEDSNIAEDVVQEALIQAFLKLGTLFDISKFLPWLQRIVKNQAMMKLRRGGLYAKEKPFTSFEKPAAAENTDWRDLDTVLHQFTMRSQKTSHKDAILDQVIETQLPVFIADLVRVLGAREKQVFEQYFYEQLSPQDIAAYFDTPINNIHKSLSRIRKKLSLQIHDTQLLEQISEHLKSNGYRSQMLNKPSIEGQPRYHPDLTLPVSLFHALRSIGKEQTLAAVIGFSGYAFMLNVIPPHIHAGSTGDWDWDTFLSNGLLTLGYRSKFFDYQHYRHAPFSKHKTKKLFYALQIIRDSIDKGTPAPLMGAINNEAALVYGYNDQTQILFVTDTRTTKEIPYCQLYYNSLSEDTRETRSLYGYVLDGEIESLDPLLQMTRLVERIISYAEGRDYTFMPCVNGLAAYDAWIEAYERKTVDPLGNSSCLLFYGWLREQATLFWQEQYLIWKAADEPFNQGEILSFMQLTMGCYQAVAAIYQELQALFPFPSGGDPHQPEAAAKAAELLRAAKTTEKEAIGHLHNLLAELKKDQSKPIIHMPIHPFYSFGGDRPKIKVEPIPSEYVLHSSIIVCRNLGRSMEFYRSLSGIELPTEWINAHVGVFPMQGLHIMLMDLRLDLVHINWKPSMYIQARDIELAFATAKRNQWEILYTLDKGGTQTDFFVMEDTDGHQIIVGSHALYPYMTMTQAASHPIQLKMEQICLSVKDNIASHKAYTELFGTSLSESGLVFKNKFHPQSLPSPIQLIADDLNLAYRTLRDAKVPILSYPGDLADSTLGMIIQDPDGIPVIIRQQSHSVVREDMLVNGK